MRPGVRRGVNVEWPGPVRVRAIPMSADIHRVGLLRRYSKKGDLTSTAVRLAKLLEVEREPVPEPEPFHVRRVEWRLGEGGIKELIVDYEAGLAVPELQTKYSLSKGSVRKLLSEAGVSMRRRPLPDEIVEQIIELYETGLSIREVGAKVGVPKTTVQNLLANSEVVMRPAVRVPRAGGGAQPGP